MKIAELRLGFGFVPRSRMDSEDLDCSARIKWFHFVIMLRIGIFYSSIVSHSMSEKTPFVAHGKQSKHYMTSKG